MKLFTERNLLYIYVPLDFHNPHKKNYPLPISKNGTTVYGKYWGADEYMLIDVLTDYIRRLFYQKIKVTPKLIKNMNSIFTKDLIENLVQNTIPDKYIAKFEVAYKTLRRLYPFLEKFPPKRFHQLIDKTSKIKLSTNYKVKLRYEWEENNWDHDSRRSRKLKKMFDSKITIEFNTPQNIFNYEADSADGNYRIKFDTGLGLCFINNIRMFEWERLSSDFYNLRKNAQNFYRRFILPKKKDTNVELALDMIADYLNFYSPNQTVKKEAIGPILKDLKGNNYIEWEKKKGYRETIYSIKKSVSN